MSSLNWFLNSWCYLIKQVKKVTTSMLTVIIFKPCWWQSMWPFSLVSIAQQYFCSQPDQGCHGNQCYGLWPLMIPYGWGVSQFALPPPPPYLSNTLTNLCIALYCILLYSVVLNCIVLLIYCYVDIIQYNEMHKFVGVLDNPSPPPHPPPASLRC